MGDCYLIAGLASVIVTEPMAIKRAVRDNGKTATARFYEPVYGTEETGIFSWNQFGSNKNVKKYYYVTR